MHFVHVDRTVRDTRDSVSLDSLIDNIKLLSDFYQRATLTYKLGTRTPLFNVLCEKEILKPEPEKVEEEEKKAEEEPSVEVPTGGEDDGEKVEDAAVEAEKEDDSKQEAASTDPTPAEEKEEVKADDTETAQ